MFAGWLAVRFNSVLVAVLGIIGGYGTPIMLSTGVVNFLGLYGYMLMLGIGVLGISYRKNWPLLNYLSFAATYALFFTSMRDYETAYFWQVLPFLTAFFVLFSTMAFFHNMMNRVKSNLLDLLALFANAGIFFVTSFRLVDELYGQKWVAAVTLGLATFYIVHVYYFLVRRVLDRELLLSFTGLAAFFVAVTIPLVLSRQWITVSWAIQAFVMLWIAGKLNSQFLRHAAYALYAIVLWRFLLIDLRTQFAVPLAAGLPLMEYLRQLVERVVMFGVPIASLAGAYRLLNRPPAAGGMAVEPGNDIRGWIRDKWAVRAALAGVVGLLFVYAYLEMNRTFGYLYPELRLPVLTLIGLALCVYLLYEFLETASNVALGILLFFTFAVLAKLFFFDVPAWGFTERMLYGGAYSARDAAFRFLDFGAVIAFFAVSFALLLGHVEGSQGRKAGVLFGSLGVGLLFLYTTLELNTLLFAYKPEFRSGGISILWSLFALGLILSGIWKRVTPLRFIGLALFAVVAFKVFFVDLARLDQIYRIVAFILLGILVLSGSFVYLKYRHVFAIEGPATEGKDQPQ
jgi:hypothetical protein